MTAGRRSPARTAGAEMLAAWALVAAVHGVAMEGTRPEWVGVGTAALSQLYSAGHFAVMAIAAAGAVALWTRFGPRSRRLTYAAVALTAAALAIPVLLPDLADIEGRSPIRLGLPLSGVLLVAAAGAAVSGSARLGEWLSSPARDARAWGAFGATLGVACAMGNEVVLPGGYPGAHFFLAAVAATLMGTSIGGSADGAPRPGAGSSPRSGPVLGSAFRTSEASGGVWDSESRISGASGGDWRSGSWAPGPMGLLPKTGAWTRRLAAWAGAGAAFAGALSIATVPPDAVTRELLRLPGEVVTPLLARARPHDAPPAPDAPGETPPTQSR